MNKKKSANKSKLIVASFVTALLYSLCGYMIYTGNTEEISVLLFGALLGSYYVYRGGSLPKWYIKFTEITSLLGQGGLVTEDDDPDNLSPKIYLSVIAAVITIALIAYFIYV
jgi:hypothetical protein